MNERLQDNILSSDELDELLRVELYQLFREYSGVDIDYNEFVTWLEGQIKTLKTIEIEEKANESTTIKR